jgi:hypothetical protein
LPARSAGHFFQNMHHEKVKHDKENRKTAYLVITLLVICKLCKSVKDKSALNVKLLSRKCIMLTCIIWGLKVHYKRESLDGKSASNKTENQKISQYNVKMWEL